MKRIVSSSDFIKVVATEDLSGLRNITPNLSQFGNTEKIGNAYYQEPDQTFGESLRWRDTFVAERHLSSIPVFVIRDDVSPMTAEVSVALETVSLHKSDTPHNRHVLVLTELAYAKVVDEDFEIDLPLALALSEVISATSNEMLSLSKTCDMSDPASVAKALYKGAYVTEWMRQDTVALRYCDFDDLIAYREAEKSMLSLMWHRRELINRLKRLSSHSEFGAKKRRSHEFFINYMVNGKTEKYVVSSFRDMAFKDTTSRDSSEKFTLPSTSLPHNW